ncbi:hypothetical protein ACFX2F_004215 [Malus domestica]
MSEITVPVVKRSPISFYLRFPQQRHTLSALLSQHFFISENAFPKNPPKLLCVPNSLGYSCEQPISKQKYFIS